MNNQDLEPIFDSDGNYNPEKAYQEMIEANKQEEFINQSISNDVISPKFDDDGRLITSRPLSLYEAEKLIEQMENGTMSVDGELIDNSMDLPGNVIK